MLLRVEFDINADIIDVPLSVIDNKEKLRKDFLKWLCNQNTKHRYWITIKGSKGLCFRAEAFVEWLNQTVLYHSGEHAIVVRQNISLKEEKNLPTILF